MVKAPRSGAAASEDRISSLYNVALVASAALALAACEYAAFDDCTIACTASSGCPSGYGCGSEGLCRPAGAAGSCAEQACRPGTMQECYTGAAGTKGVGPCVGGQKFCSELGEWGPCMGEVIPLAEQCADAVDNNCNGATDELDDADGDGFTTCGGDCCDSTECPEPAAVNPGAFDVPGNQVDDDCNPATADTAAVCDQGLVSGSTAALDFAKALDLCQTTTPSDKTWGVLDAKISLTDGNGTPDREGHAIRPQFGTGVLPRAGNRLVLISSGGAAAKTDTNPVFHAWAGYTHTGVNSSAFPADWYAANGNMIPNRPGCPRTTATTAFDAVMLTFRIRVPTNARSFELATNFFSADFPEFVCSGNADTFVVLLDSAYTGTPANPTDKNLAFLRPNGSSMKHPLDVDLAFGGAGVFTQCVNGATGCETGSTAGTIASCTATTMLATTGFDDAAPAKCDTGSVVGGGTGWLITRGNVVPGETITLRLAIWDVIDHVFDSLAILDNFRWSTEPVEPGTAVP